MNWAEKAVFYQIYPLGMLGAEPDNDFLEKENLRLLQLKDWKEHLVKLGVNGVYFCPVFESSHHGYDTKDFFKIDGRLGTNEEFINLIKEYHESDIKVVLDGVFNHVGRDFWAFRDVCVNREQSKYVNWFFVNFSGNSNYNDGFWYDGWEGHYELVKLNLNNHEVRKHIFEAVSMWIDEFNIDGLRLDVAYSLSHDFLRELSNVCRSKREDFWIMGETLHGDYRQLMDGGNLDSVTNYECYKGLYSSFNEKNLFEIGHSLNRQFGKEEWTLYKGRHLFNFVDNHDVTRIATMLKDSRHLPLIYALLFTMPGIPCVYYGSEWGMEGDKKNGDNDLRPKTDKPIWNELTDYLSKLSQIHKESKCLTHGNYTQLLLTNQQYIFERSVEGKRIMIVINIDENEFTAHFNANAGCGIDLLTGQKVDFGGGLKVKPFTALIIDNLQ